MKLVNETIYLIRKELLLEWRQKYAISGILLYVCSTVFVVYSSFAKIQADIWNILFWIIILFASVNAIAKSFMQESGHRQLYYYLLANPTAIILSKVIYNTLLLLFLSFLTFISFSTVAGNPVKDGWQFFMAMFLASLGFSLTFTFISAIAIKANNSSTLMAILSFPLVIPTILLLIKISANALRLMQDTGLWRDIGNLIAIDFILIALTFILFPYLWRD